MAVKPVVYDDSTKKHRPLGSGEKMDGLSASSIISSQSGNLITTGSDGLAYATGSGIIDPAADNLLEATSGGKVKMDVDRLAEWLDGHPADAKTLSEAIKVVSGDSGNLIAKGSDKGAYMSSAQLAAALAGMSAAQLQQLAAALADGKTIVASGGKLTVDPTSATAAQLNKISSAIRKSGGGLSVGSDGKLSVDFASMDPAIMRAVVLSMVQQGGGLAVDSAGQLYVDFTTMPDDKFQQLKDSLDMQRTLNGNLSVFVDYDHSAASDTYRVRDPESGQLVIDGDRGKETKPFKTISGAVRYVTKVYALGDFNAYIRVKPRSNSSAENYPYYKESVTLPQFTATAGTISIRAFDDGNPPKICNPSPSSYIFRCTGGTWYLRRLNVDNTASAAGPGNHFPNCVAATGGGAVHLQGMDLDLRFSGERDEGYYLLRVVVATAYGLVSFDTLSGYQNKLSYDVGNADALQVIHLERVGSLQIPSSNVPDIAGISDPKDSIYAILCTGTPTTFLSCTTQSIVSYIGGSSYYPRFVYGGSGSPTGKRYVIQTGSGVYVPRTTGTAAGTALPGDVDGTAGEASSVVFDNPPTVAQVREVSESLMGCWYKEGTVAAIPYSS